MSAISDLLTEWLPHQRWYAGKGKAISGVTIERQIALDESSELMLTVLRVDADGGPDRYQLLLGRLTGELPSRLSHALIGEAEGAVFYDAAHSQDATAILLALIAAEDERDGVTFSCAGEIDTSLPSRVISGEQSNTSIVYGEELILKLFRRLQPGINPDLEVSRALAASDNPHIARPVGWIETDIDGQSSTLALLQVFQRHATDGWAMATASVRDLFAEGDLHADEVGGDFAAESERLGAATAGVHLALRDTLPNATVGPETYQATVRQLRERLDVALTIVPDLEPHADALRARYDAVAGLTKPILIQRVHGDYHLGQVLRTQTGWVLLDFEGEPARPLAERTALMSPLRDVAGMLRSYDYAARHLLAERGGEPQLAYRAAEWAERNRQAFCDGYARAAGADPRDDAVLLRAFELDKAVYEVVYEARNRPSWLAIPVGSIERLSATAGSELR